MTGDLAGRRVLLTGATGAIGRAVARELASRGASLALVARSAPALEALCGELAGTQHDALCLDVRDEQAWRDHEGAIAPDGLLHGVVCAAAVIGPIGPLGSWDTAGFADTFAVNVTGTLLAISANLAGLRRARGSVVAFSGGGATAPFPRFDAYAASKAALVRLCENLALELGHDHIRCNAVAPGFVDSAMHDAERAAGPELVGADYYARSLGARAEGGDPPELAARLVAYLLSDAAARLTGKLIAAKWDPWQEEAFRQRCAHDPDFATLRRIDDHTFFDRRS